MFSHFFAFLSFWINLFSPKMKCLYLYFFISPLMLECTDWPHVNVFSRLICQCVPCVKLLGVARSPVWTFFSFEMLKWIDRCWLGQKIYRNSQIQLKGFTFHFNLLSVKCSLTCWMTDRTFSQLQLRSNKFELIDVMLYQRYWFIGNATLPICFCNRNKTMSMWCMYSK